MNNLLFSSLPLDRTAVIAALSHLRQEWEEAANGEPLHTLHGNVGMFFDDVMDALCLTELEKGEVRGLWRRGSEILSLHNTTS